MIIIKNEKNPLFVLQTKNSTYAMKVTEFGQIEHLYYGRKIHLNDEEGLSEHHAFLPGNTNAYRDDVQGVSLEDMRLEYSSYGKGDIREPLVELVHGDGTITSDFCYESFEYEVGKKPFEQLPGSYGEDDEVETLRIILKDSQYNIQLNLNYYVYENCDVISKNTEIINHGENPIALKRLMSNQLDFDKRKMHMTTFTGAWAREMKKNTIPIVSGKYINDSYTGTSSNRSNPFVIISGAHIDEYNGECYGINLIYSGNHQEIAMRDSFGRIRFLQGINPTSFIWALKSGEKLEAPESVMTYSGGGFSRMSHNMHCFVKNHIVRGYWKDKERPILLNSWEATYFKVNESRLVKLAETAKNVGIELFVLDDGWFGNRNDDTSSLGDWYPNKKKLPGGLKGIADKIKALGLDFGIWVEPEMISENSKLYERHPDWAVRIPDAPHSKGRNQMILDLSRSDVQNFVIKCMRDVFSSADISYVKWDMNRTFTDYYSTKLPIKRQGEMAHRYVLGLYRIMRILTKEFPNILFEGCASGGNRFDLGMLCYFPQIWASDNTDALCRAEIQNGYSYGYPPSVITSHVSDVPNHQTLRKTPLETRFHVASFGILGYECNLSDMGREELAAVKEQISIYKKWRSILQFGDFYRGNNLNKDTPMSALSMIAGNKIEWSAVSKDKEHAVCFLMQGLVQPNMQQEILFPKGLIGDKQYRFYSRSMNFDLKQFGGLVNYVAPIHVKQDGAVHNMLSRFVKMHSETEEHVMYGDAMMFGGIHLKSAFSGNGYDDSVRFYPDFASRMYFMEKIEEQEDKESN